MQDLNQDIYRYLVQINQRLEHIEDTLQAVLGIPSLGLTVQRLSNTVSGPDGQVLPGPEILTGTEASTRFRAFQNPTVLPLNDLPPWTHMALAQGVWWLVQMT